MKKYIFTESQVKKIVNRLMEEDIESAGCGQHGVPSQKSLFKDCKISQYDNETEIRKLINSPKCKFKVMSVEGGVKLNGKWATEGMIIVPNTTVEICTMSTYIYLSGMGYPEAFITFGNDGIPEFGSQHA